MVGEIFRDITNAGADFKNTFAKIGVKLFKEPFIIVFKFCEYVEGGLADFPVAAARIFKNAIECMQAIFPPNFLSLFIAAAMIGNANFVEPQIALGQFACYLRLEAEAILLDLNAFQNITAKHLIARFHISEIQVGEHVRDEGEKPVANAVPEVKYTTCLA